MKTLFIIILSFFGFGNNTPEILPTLSTSTPVVIEQSTTTIKEIVNKEVKKVIKQVTENSTTSSVENTSSTSTTTPIVEPITYGSAPVEYVPVVIYQEPVKQVEQTVQVIEEPKTKAGIVIRDCFLKGKFRDLYNPESTMFQLCFMVLDDNGKATHKQVATVSDETGKTYPTWSNSNAKIFDDNGNRFNGENFNPIYITEFDYSTTSNHTITINTDNGLMISQEVSIK